METQSISSSEKDSTELKLTSSNASSDIPLIDRTTSASSSRRISLLLAKGAVYWGPWSGILCMILAGVSIFACLGILIGSHGVETADWITEPSTYIAIFTAIANQSIRFAAIEGVLIAWWIRASRGCTVAQLEHYWYAGTSFGGGMFNIGRKDSRKPAITFNRLNMLGLACILSTVVSIDGPLLQRSSTVVSVPITNQPVHLNVKMAPELPTNWGDGFWERSYNRYNGAFNHSTHTIPSPSGPLSNMISTTGYLKNNGTLLTLWEDPNAPIPGIMSGCPPDQECKAKIRAPALARTCKTESFPAGFSTPVNWKEEIIELKYTAPLNHQALVLAAGLVVDGEREQINLYTQYATEENCKFTIHYTSCLMDSAIGEYDVTIKNDRVTLDSAYNPKIIALANNTAVQSKDPVLNRYKSTLAAIVDCFGWFKSTGIWYFTKNNPTLQVGQWGYGLTYMFLNGNNCPVAAYTDPHENLAASLNRLMFLQGMSAAQQGASENDVESQLDPGLSINAQVTGYVHGTHNVFHFNYWWFLAAALVEIICICLIAPTYWGWRNLKTHVSFSPIDIAKAFQSPLFTDRDVESSDCEDAEDPNNRRLQLKEKTTAAGTRAFVFETV